MNKFFPPCEECGGSCCDYIAIEIGKPKNKQDYDHIRWYLVHNNVHVFIDHDKNWFVEFRTVCSKKNDRNRCTIYSTRPRICKGHGNLEGECEYFDSPYIEYFRSAEDFEKYLETRGKDWKYKQNC